MLTIELNDLLTRVERDAPMGEMLRNNYWFPAALSCKLERDGAPLRVKLLGKPFVVFRSTDGRVGFFDEHCPHRRVSLALARNEDNALRCIYHGWKFGVDGVVREVPTEPHNQTKFCQRVPLRHYPARESAGIVWVWLGRDEPKPFPDFEFMSLPEEQVYSVQQHVRCNWVQDVEGGMDSAHTGILHSHWLKSVGATEVGVDTAPLYEFEPRKYGFCVAAVRRMPDGNNYIRVNHFAMPWYSFICPEEMPEGDRLVIMTTPVDNENCIHWSLRYNRFRPLKPSYVNPAEAHDRGSYPPAPPGGPETSWGQDRAAMARGHFSGFHVLNTEDFAVEESQGAILDRSQEYLNAGDRSVVQLRKELLNAVTQYVAGEFSPQKHGDLSYRSIKADALVLATDARWQEASLGE
jgi:phenylpropionate dioxygenase-like ring-hydroxylating dioxygenase large terminal subunit